MTKYANTTRARVRVWESESDGELAFEVVDDSDGFDPSSERRGRSGLLGMADRLDAIGGALGVRSRPGSRTTVAGRIPVRGLADR